MNKNIFFAIYTCGYIQHNMSDFVCERCGIIFVSQFKLEQHLSGRIECGAVTFDRTPILTTGTIRVDGSDYVIPVGTGATIETGEVWSNKTLTDPAIVDASDNSKMLNFDLSSMSTDSTLTITADAANDGYLYLPPVTGSDTLVSCNATQTLTNKVFISQLVLTPFATTITATSVSLDASTGAASSFAVDTTAAGVSVNNVTSTGVNNGLIIVIHHTVGSNNLTIKHNTSATGKKVFLNKSGADIVSNAIASYLYVYNGTSFMQI